MAQAEIPVSGHTTPRAGRRRASSAAGGSGSVVWRAPAGLVPASAGSSGSVVWRAPAVLVRSAAAALVPLLGVFLVATAAVLVIGLLGAVADVLYFVDPVTGAPVSVFVRLLVLLEPYAEALETTSAEAWTRPQESALKQWLLALAAYGAKGVRAVMALKRFGPPLGPSAAAAGVSSATAAAGGMLEATRAAEAWVAARLLDTVQAVLDAYVAARDALVEVVLTLVRPWVPPPYWPAVSVGGMLIVTLATLSVLWALSRHRPRALPVVVLAAAAAEEETSCEEEKETLASQ